jgi:tungstate transport system substrate-binding protein
MKGLATCRWLALCALLAASACRTPPPAHLDIATTTSVQNSGLLDAILPHFQPAAVRVHAVGSGLALKMLADRTVDLVISHAPDAERRYLSEHRDWVYRKIAFNHFLVVGPADDPAHVADAVDVLEAFRRIAASSAVFVSRGDQSGTDEREQSLWKQAAVSLPQARRYISGASMAVTLRQADERGAYTLSDESTFWQLEARLRHKVLFANDARLVNSYAVVYPSSGSLASNFADWLASGDGRSRMSAYRVAGRVAFTVWPASCANDVPDASPCLPAAPGR